MCSIEVVELPTSQDLHCPQVRMTVDSVTLRVLVAFAVPGVCKGTRVAAFFKAQHLRINSTFAAAIRLA